MRLLNLLSSNTELRDHFFTSASPVVLMGRGHSGTRVLSSICGYLGVNLGADEDSKAGDVSDERFQKEIKALLFIILINWT